MKTTSLILLSALSGAHAYAYTLPEQPTKAYDCNECGKLSHETLYANWATSDASVDTKARNSIKSYSYNQVISAEQLNQGVVLSTRAPGAVVHITPLQQKPVPELLIQAPEKKYMDVKDVAAVYSQNESSKESLIADEYQTTMQFKPQLGFGKFVIKSKNSNADKAHSYLLNVFDKFSLIGLKVEPQALHYQYGDEFTAIITLKDSAYSYPVDDVYAQLITPDERTIPLQLQKIKRNQFKVSAPLRSEINSHGENWYIEVQVYSDQGGNTVQRDARAAFSYAIPSASVLNLQRMSSDALTFTATVEIATASRYGLQSVLFQTDASGKQVPVEISQHSQWLEPGKQTIQFHFDNSKHLADDTLSVGYIHLTDYGQLKTVYEYNQPIKLSKLMD